MLLRKEEKKYYRLQRMFYNNVLNNSICEPKKSRIKEIINTRGSV